VPAPGRTVRAAKNVPSQVETLAGSVEKKRRGSGRGGRRGGDMKMTVASPSQGGGLLTCATRVNQTQ